MGRAWTHGPLSPVAVPRWLVEYLCKTRLSLLSRFLLARVREPIGRGTMELSWVEYTWGGMSGWNRTAWAKHGRSLILIHGAERNDKRRGDQPESDRVTEKCVRDSR